MRKLRLLVVTQWFAPGYRAGGPIRSTTNLVDALDGQCDIWVVTSDRDHGAIAPFPGITPDQWTPRGSTARVMYVSPGRQTMNGIGEILRTVGADCVYLNSMFSARFTIPALVARWRGRLGGKVVLAPRGELLPGALQYKAVKKGAFLSLLRCTGVVPTLHFHATDEQERMSIVSRLAVDPACVTTLPNFPTPPAHAPSPLAKSANAVELLFLSRVSPKKNLLFLLERLVHVPATLKVHLTIAGPHEDDAYWRHCSRAIAALPGHVHVSVTGAVPHEEVRALMARHHVLVLPTFGENYGHSIIEALGTGRPVLISDKTPWRRLTNRGAGWDLPLEDPPAFTTALATAARLDQDSFDHMCRAAHEYARVACSTDTLRSRYVTLFTPGDQASWQSSGNCCPP